MTDIEMYLEAQKHPGPRVIFPLLIDGQIHRLEVINPKWDLLATSILVLREMKKIKQPWWKFWLREYEHKFYYLSGGELK